MKKVIVLCSIVVVILVLAFLFINSCGSETCTEPTGPDYHYVRFTLDGPVIDAEIIILNFGVDKDISSPTFALWPDGNETGTNMVLEGWYCGGGQETSINFRLLIGLIPYTPGVYIGTYGGESPTAGFFTYFGLEIIENGERYYYNYTFADSSLTIITFGDVGGDAVGTFDVTMVSDASAPSYGINLTAIGEFRFLRVPDKYL